MTTLGELKEPQNFNVAPQSTAGSLGYSLEFTRSNHVAYVLTLLTPPAHIREQLLTFVSRNS